MLEIKSIWQDREPFQVKVSCGIVWKVSRIGLLITPIHYAICDYATFLTEFHHNNAISILFHTLSRLRFDVMKTHSDGKCLACTYRAKFVEVSVGINHNVDELLAGTLAQIRLKKEQCELQVSALNECQEVNYEFNVKKMTFNENEILPHFLYTSF